MSATPPEPRNGKPPAADGAPAEAGEGGAATRRFVRAEVEDAADAGRTLLHGLREAVAKFGDRPAIRYRHGDRWDTITYAALWKRASELAMGLRAAGVTRDDRVLILAENGPEVIIAELAAIACRASAVVLFPKYAPPVIRGVVDQVAPRVAIVESGPSLARYLEARKDAVDRIKVISYGDGIPGPRGEIRAAGAVAADGRRRIERCRVENTGNPFEQLVDRARSSDPIALAYSMGGTRHPRGAILTHANVVAGDLARLFGPTRADDVVLVQIPLAQPFARLSICYGLLLAGATIAFPGSDDRVLEALGAVSPTMLFLFPTALAPLKRQIFARVSGGPRWSHTAFDWALRKARDARTQAGGRPPWYVDRFILSRIRRQLGGRLRAVYVGGGAADGDLLSFFQDAGIATYEGYSLAEATPIVAISRPGDGVDESVRYDLGIVGKPIPGVEVKCEPEGLGEILVRGLATMRGYFREERETKQALPGDGWLRTGDLGYVDPQGFIVIQDRKADTFKLADGRYVAPAVVEAELKKSPLVRDACVLGRGRPCPIALVVPDFQELAKLVFRGDPELVRKANRRSLLSNPASRVMASVELAKLAASLTETPWAQPRAFRLLAVEFTPAVELTPAMTLRRRAIEDRFKIQIEQIYAELATEVDVPTEGTGMRKAMPIEAFE